MTERIIFENDEGGVSIIVPSPAALRTYTIQEIAAKDVPSGKHYAIVPTEEIPSDRTFRDAWEVDEAALVDGVGNASNKWD